MNDVPQIPQIPQIPEMSSDELLEWFNGELLDGMLSQAAYEYAIERCVCEPSTFVMSVPYAIA